MSEQIKCSSDISQDNIKESEQEVIENREKAIVENMLKEAGMNFYEPEVVANLLDFMNGRCKQI